MSGRYTEDELTLEMQHIATGTARYGAKAPPSLSTQDHALLDRFETGKQDGHDSQTLKALSLKVHVPAISWLDSIPPADVVAAAERVGNWFAARNISYWTLGPCQSRATRHSTMSIMLTPDSGVA